MSSSESDSAVDRPEPLVVLSHLVHRLLKREGGSVPLERVTLRVSDYVDIGDQEAADLIDAGAAEGVFTLGRGSGGSTTIVGVSPQGPEPAVITEAFGGPADATGTADFQALEVVTETIATALRDAGYATFTDLADADVGDLTGLTGTLTESRAEAIIQAAPQHVPVGVWLARSADVRYGRRVDETTGRGTARVLDITAATEPVGEPRYRSEGLEPDELASETGYLMKFGDVSHRGLTPFDVASLHNVPAYPLPEAALESLPAHVRADLERDGAVQMIAVYDRDPASIRRRRARLGGARLPQANRRVGGR